MIRSGCIASLRTGLLLKVAIDDEGVPDVPPAAVDGDWTAFIQGENGYLAEVMIAPAGKGSQINNCASGQGE